MNSRRSYLDTMNAGRARRATTSLEQLNRTLEELEQRIGGEEDARREPAGLRYDDRRDLHAPREPRYDRGDYHSLAREFDIARAREEELRSMHHIAGELESLRRDMGSGLRGELAALRSEISRLLKTTGQSGPSPEMASQFDRLADLIRDFNAEDATAPIDALRAEMTEMKQALQLLAREDTVRSVDRRWDELDQRWQQIADRFDRADATGADDKTMQVLTARLDQIGGVVSQLPDTGAVRSLDDKVRMLATAVDQLAHRQEAIGPEAFDALDERLDEITRAIAASLAAPASTLEAEAMNRIEVRVSSLSRQVEELLQDRGSDVLAEQMGLLGQRIDEIARKIELPDQMVEGLSRQLSEISARLDKTSDTGAIDRMFGEMDDRFMRLADMMEQRQGDVLEQSRAMFAEMETRLDEVNRSLSMAEDVRDPLPAFLHAMDTRFAEITARLEDRPGTHDDAQFDRLEARLEDIAARLDRTARQPGGGLDGDIVRGLEEQVAALAQHLSQPGATMPEFVDLRPRLDDIERAVSQSREDLVEAARIAAADAISRLPHRGGQEGGDLGELADELRSLEALARRSDDRNARTFEAIHDTLLKIVDRLGAIESGPRPAGERPVRSEMSKGAIGTPPIQPELDDDWAAPSDPLDVAAPSAADLPAQELRTPASAARQAAAAARQAETKEATVEAKASRSLFANLGRRLKAKKAQKGEVPALAAKAQEPVSPSKDEAPSVEIDKPLDPKISNQPLEPGSGAPDLNAIMRRVREERGQKPGAPDSDAAKSDFIAAARRAAQAAAAEADLAKRKPSKENPEARFGFGKLLRGRTKTLALGVAILALGLAATQIIPHVTASDQSQVAQDAPAAIAAAPLVADAAGEAEEVVVASLSQAGESAGMIAAAKAKAEPRMAAVAPSTPAPAVERNAADWLQAPAEEAVAARFERSVPAAEAVSDAAAEPEASGWQAFVVPEEAGPEALRAAATDGDPRALLEIGNRYAQGVGVEEDLEAAATWYELAAELGLAPAQYRIANMYEKGIGVERDLEKARGFYEMAAEQGNASAMHNLAVLHAMGADGAADNRSAVRWFSQAADLGVRDSQFNLGILTAKGVGTQQNLIEAYKWFDIVAREGDEDAAGKREEVARLLEPEQLERAKATAQLWQVRPLDQAANTVDVPAEWREDVQSTASIDMQAVLRNVQAILNANGYPAGTPDGIMGQRTRTAISSFQKDNDLPQTGEVDEQLISLLLERR